MKITKWIATVFAFATLVAALALLSASPANAKSRAEFTEECKNNGGEVKEVTLSDGRKTLQCHVKGGDTWAACFNYTSTVVRKCSYGRTWQFRSAPTTIQPVTPVRPPVEK